MATGQPAGRGTHEKWKAMIFRKDWIVHQDRIGQAAPLCPRSPQFWQQISFNIWNITLKTEFYLKLKCISYIIWLYKTQSPSKGARRNQGSCTDTVIDTATYPPEAFPVCCLGLTMCLLKWDLMFIFTANLSFLPCSMQLQILCL